MIVINAGELGMAAAAGKDPPRGGGLVRILKGVVNGHTVHGHPNGAKRGVGGGGVIGGIQGDSKGFGGHHDSVGVISAGSSSVVLTEFESLQPARDGCVPPIRHVKTKNGRRVVENPVAGDDDLVVGGVLGQGNGVLDAGSIDRKGGGATVVQLALVIGDKEAGPLLKIAFDPEKSPGGHVGCHGNVQAGVGPGSRDGVGLHQRPIGEVG